MNSTTTSREHTTTAQLRKSVVGYYTLTQRSKSTIDRVVTADMVLVVIIVIVVGGHGHNGNHVCGFSCREVEIH